jgi:hypothetical protein
MQYVVGRGFVQGRKSTVRKSWVNAGHFIPDISRLQRAGVHTAFTHANALRINYTVMNCMARYTLRLWVLDICEEAEHYARHPVWMEEE